MIKDCINSIYCANNFAVHMLMNNRLATFIIFQGLFYFCPSFSFLTLKVLLLNVFSYRYTFCISIYYTILKVYLYFCQIIFLAICLVLLLLNNDPLSPQSLLLRKLASSAPIRTRARFACWRHIPNPLRMSSSMTNYALTS